MRIFKLLLVLLSLVIICTSCAFDRGIIIFGSEPISAQNAASAQKVFREGTKVYYFFIAPKEMNNEFIRVQIFQMTDKAPWGGNEVVRTKDYRLMKDERYYHTNYFVLHEKGRYVMQVFSHDDFKNPLALNDFYIE